MIPMCKQTKNVYSTEERIVGKWLGKDLYRKVVFADGLNSSTSFIIKINDIIQDCDKNTLRITEADFKRAGHDQWFNAKERFINFEADEIQLDGFTFHSEQFNASKVRFTIEYTKLT